MSPCAGCHAGCCRSFAVPVTGADLLRIEAELGLDFAQVGCRWEDQDGLISNGVVPQFHFADEPETPFVICLRQEASQLFRRTTKCLFLQETPPDGQHPLGQAACSIYDSRPLVCRVYPTRLSSSGMLAEVHAVPAHGRPQDPHPIYNLCPRQWTTDDLDALQAVQNLVLAQFEHEFFAQVAAVWNKVVEDFALFPEFLREVYRARIVMETPRGVEATIPHSFQKPFMARNRRAA